ncbi:MAG TPA: exodeoxyribonuclease VII large subunit [bacterium]|nr:exodeoxyribonuclease VII large subunit [bacterium]HNS48906.1 exodeoxyribonuclease VII large subunit [bacterium]
MGEDLFQEKTEGSGSPTERIYTVTELSQAVRHRLESAFPLVWVEGEVSSLRQPISGHLYFSLKDAGSQLRVVLFRGSAARLRFKPADGLQVLVFGRVSTYADRSEYQVIAQLVEPRGLGALQLEFERLKKKLAAEGLFAPERKRPIPVLIKRLGVVTSPTGAAVRDILKVLKRRNPAIEVVIYPALVQGKGAAAEIVRGIMELNRLGGFDALLVTRGGGSLEDLWAFNEEPVARAIAESLVPVISAVGHEVDYTISDFVADLRAPTPSAAAELISLHRAETVERIGQLADRLAYLMRSRLAELDRRLKSITGRYGFQRPQELLATLTQRLDDLYERLARGQRNQLSGAGQRWEALARRLDGLSPLAVLDRGYSITLTYPEGRVVKEASLLPPGRLIRSRFLKGEVVSRVVRPAGAGRSGPEPPEQPGLFESDSGGDEDGQDQG